MFVRLYLVSYASYFHLVLHVCRSPYLHTHLCSWRLPPPPPLLPLANKVSEKRRNFFSDTFLHRHIKIVLFLGFTFLIDFYNLLQNSVLMYLNFSALNLY
jgi:hypothetical protein